MAATYDPERVVGTWNGINIVGYMDGTMIKAARAEKTWEIVAGGQGDAARVRKRNKIGTVVLTLMQTSPTNDEFSEALLADELNGNVVGPLLFTDLNGNTVLEAHEAWLEGWAEVEFGTELGSREWTLSTGSLELFVGGVL